MRKTSRRLFLVPVDFVASCSKSFVGYSLQLLGSKCIFTIMKFGYIRVCPSNRNLCLYPFYLLLLPSICGISNLAAEETGKESLLLRPQV